MVCYSCFCSLCIFILLLIDLIHRLLLGRGIGRAGLLSEKSRAGRTVGDQHRSKASGSTLRLSSCLLIKQPFFIKCNPRLTLRVLGGKGSPVWVTTKQRYKWENVFRTIMEFHSFSGGREHALGQRRPLHLAVCGGEQKVGFGKRKSDFKRIPGTRYTPAIASTSRLTGPFLLNCLRSCNSYDCQNSNFEQFQDCLFVVEIHGENIALMDNTGRYLSPGSGSQAVLKTKWMFSNSSSFSFLHKITLSFPQVWQSGHRVCVPYHPSCSLPMIYIVSKPAPGPTQWPSQSSSRSKIRNPKPASRPLAIRDLSPAA